MVPPDNLEKEVFVKEDFNGWTNRATWLVNLWLDNDGYYDNCEHVSPDAYQLGQMIRDDVEDMRPQATGLFGDAISQFLLDVNWKEIGDFVIQHRTEQN